jgi:hypothetical protein
MTQQEIHRGMRVWASDDSYVGCVRAVGDIDFEVDGTTAGAPDVRVEYGQVTWLDDFDVLLSTPRERLEPLRRTATDVDRATEVEQEADLPEEPFIPGVLDPILV